MLVLALVLLSLAGSTVTVSAAQDPKPTTLLMSATSVHYPQASRGEHYYEITLQVRLYGLRSNGWMDPIKESGPIIIQQEQQGQWKNVKTCYLDTWYGISASHITIAVLKPGDYRYRAVFEGNDKWAPSMSDAVNVPVH